MTLSKIFNKIITLIIDHYKAEGVAHAHDVDITFSEILKRQTHSSKLEAHTTQKYLKRNVYISFFDHLISELISRFA